MTTAAAKTSTVTENTSIRPFNIEIPDEALADLRRRIEATRFPEKETVDDPSQGVQLAFIQLEPVNGFEPPT